MRTVTNGAKPSRTMTVAVVTALFALVTMTTSAAAKSGPTTAFTPQNGGVYDYGIVNTGSHADQTFTLTNSGGAATASLTVSLTGSSAFTKINDTCGAVSLGPGKKCTITIRYAPTTGSASTATLTATSPKPTATASVVLRGTGGFVDVELSPASYDFGSTSGSQTFTATNKGNVSSGAYAFTGPTDEHFGVSSGNTCDGTPLAPNGSCSFTIAFTAPSDCDLEPTLYLDTASLGTYAAATVKGQQPQCMPHLTISPAIFDERAQFEYRIGANRGTPTFTVENDGTAAATSLSMVTNFADNDDGYTLDPSSGADDCQSVSTLAVGSSCTFGVTYAATPGCDSAFLYTSNVTFYDAQSGFDGALDLLLWGTC